VSLLPQVGSPESLDAKDGNHATPR
jgi:hypothetical protein